MPDRPLDLTLLAEFEQGLNVRRPEESRIPARVLGYGEISTVLEIQSAPAEGLAFKRRAPARWPPATCATPRR